MSTTENIAVSYTGVSPTCLHALSDFSPNDPANYQRFYEEVVLMAREMAKKAAPKISPLGAPFEFGIVYESSASVRASVNEVWTGILIYDRHGDQRLILRHRDKTLKVVDATIDYFNGDVHTRHIQTMATQFVDGEMMMGYYWDETVSHVPVHSRPRGMPASPHEMVDAIIRLASHPRNKKPTSQRVDLPMLNALCIDLFRHLQYIKYALEQDGDRTDWRVGYAGSHADQMVGVSAWYKLTSGLDSCNAPTGSETERPTDFDPELWCSDHIDAMVDLVKALGLLPALMQEHRDALAGVSGNIDNAKWWSKNYHQDPYYFQLLVDKLVAASE